MTDNILLDTHIALWLDSGDDRFRVSTRGLIDDCWRTGGSVLLSAVTAWEIALLVSDGRIDWDCPVEDWIERPADRPGVEIIPLIHHAAARAYRLHLEHRDPADRLLMATAIELDCALITYDARIVPFAGAHGDRHGFTIGA